MQNLYIWHIYEFLLLRNDMPSADIWWHVCVVLQLQEGDCIQPMQGPGYPAFPAIYRSFVYFLSSADAREQFRLDPMMYLNQPSPKPVVPIRIAIIGPPKSGKTTRKYSIPGWYPLIPHT